MLKRKRPALFLVVGLLNTSIDYLFYTFLTQFIFTGGQSLALVGILSGTVALIMAFATHSLITWKGRTIDRTTLVKFILFTGFGMWVIRPILLVLFSNLQGLYQWAHSTSQALHLPFSYGFIASTGAFGFMVIALLIYNYLTYDRFVFNAIINDTGRKNHSEL